MNKEKLQMMLEQKFGHKRLFGLGLILILLANTLLTFIRYMEGFGSVLYLFDFILIFIGVSAIYFAGQIRQKEKK